VISSSRNFLFFFVSWCGVRLSPLGTSATIYPTLPAPKYNYGCGAFGGMRIGKGNRSTRRKPAPVPLCSPQIPHDLGSNPARRSGMPATNRLSYGMAQNFRCLCNNVFNLLFHFVTEWKVFCLKALLGFYLHVEFCHIFF
jgi:hypothetical protein